MTQLEKIDRLASRLDISIETVRVLAENGLVRIASFNGVEFAAQVSDLSDYFPVPTERAEQTILRKLRRKSQSYREIQQFVSGLAIKKALLDKALKNLLLANQITFDGKIYSISA